MYSSEEKHLGWFYVLVIMNSAAMNSWFLRRHRFFSFLRELFLKLHLYFYFGFNVLLGYVVCLGKNSIVRSLVERC